MSLSVYLAFLLACAVVMIVPGPSVTLILANSLRHGRRAGLLNVAGGQVGLALTAGVVLLGLASLIAAMGAWFVWLRLAGAAYLIWLGVKLLHVLGRDRGGRGAAHPTRRLLPAGARGVAQQSQDAPLLRRLLPAVHRRHRRLHAPGADHGRHVHGRGGGHRQRLCAAGVPRGNGAHAPADAADDAGERRAADRRRGLAGAGAGEVRAG